MRHVVAENYLCFYALLEMVLGDIGIEMNQHQIAEELGVTVPYGYLINVKNVQYSDDSKMYGAHFNEDTLNYFFRKFGIDLSAYFINVNPFDECNIDDYMYPEIRKGKKIIYAFSHGFLYRKNDTLNIGHVALLMDVVSQNTLQIYDPGPKNYGVIEVNRHDMYDAIRCRHGGIFVIESKKSTGI